MQTKFLEKQIRKQAKRSALAEVSSKTSHQIYLNGFLEVPLKIRLKNGVAGAKPPPTVPPPFFFEIYRKRKMAMGQSKKR